ncbi:RNA-binding protein [Legionella sp. PATHC032]|uniref:RNA-binding protein n=1 Tax=Legionella sp. PATHC032 TaxID=2992039 RepID=UPI001B1843F2|nr:RNA-binding protein [Legionella sp. PATHC032]MCW8422695.1 RNA-binding protein [Legionella sp. PATHC032]HAZ7574050.1 RNA-binding protein [Legionella pneumophila]HBA1636276.1 RNA-binding protein [Legionella pneumophila]
MKILYVPFPRNQAGDLKSMVELWKKNDEQFSNVRTEIIYFSDDIDYDLFDEKIDIYICAHGSDDENLKVVFNHSNPLIAEHLDIKKVAERFERDILPISYWVSAIHLYCCGTDKKNKMMAELLGHSLLRSEKPIYHYSGSVSIVDEFGKQWSFANNAKTPIHSVAKKMFILNFFDEEQPHRAPVKKAYQSKTYKELLATKEESFFAKVKENRASVLLSKRLGKKTQNGEENPLLRKGK